MRFRGQEASAIFYRGQRVSALYWGAHRIWLQNQIPAPLRTGQLALHGEVATFTLGPPHLLTGNLNLHGFALTTQQRVTLAAGNLHLHGLPLDSFLPLAKGDLHITGMAASFRFIRTMAKGDLEISGFAGTFGLLGAAISDISIDNNTINGDTLVIGTLSTTGGTLPITYTVL